MTALTPAAPGTYAVCVEVRWKGLRWPTKPTLVALIRGGFVRCDPIVGWGLHEIHEDRATPVYAREPRAEAGGGLRYWIIPGSPLFAVCEYPKAPCVDEAALIEVLRDDWRNMKET